MNTNDSILILLNEINDLQTVLLRDVRAAGAGTPEVLLKAASLLEAEKDEELLLMLTTPPGSHGALVAAHVFRGLSALRLGDLAGALAEQAALQEVAPQVAEYLGCCFRISDEIRVLIEEDMPTSPLSGGGADIGLADLFDGMKTMEPDELGVQLIHALLAIRTARESHSPEVSVSALQALIRALPEEIADAKVRSMVAMAYYDLGFLAVKMEDFEYARKALEKGLTFDAKNRAIHHELGFVVGKSGDWDLAIRHYKTAIEVDRTEGRGASAGAWRGIGFALIEKGDLDEAERALRASLKFDPGNETALNELTYLQHLRQGAEAAPSQTIETKPFSED